MSIGNMQSLPQWFLYHLEWDEAKRKFKKMPCGMDGVIRKEQSAASVMSTWDVAMAALDKLGRDKYALGFWLTESDPYFLLDLDNVIIEGTPTHDALALLQSFNGTYMDVTSSHRGYHIIGRYTSLPEHRNRSPKELGVEYEFYCKDRGIAFGINAVGTADADCTAVLPAVLAKYFPPRPKSEGGNVRRPEWRGPEDDDVLVGRFLAARQSVAVAAGGKVGLRDLWAGQCDHNSDFDMALASHLAWWTGCDGERIERLMFKSGMVRAKWNERRGNSTYLKDTIEAACAGTTSVYQEPQRDMSVLRGALGLQEPVLIGDAPVTVQYGDIGRQVEQFVIDINMAGTYTEIMEVVIPRIAMASVPSAYVERLCGTLNKKLDFFDAKMPVAKLRALLSPPRVATSMEAPPWVYQHCFVRKGDVFYNALTGSEMTSTGFINTYSRDMPLKQNGERECPVKFSRNHWNMVVVDDKAYRPDQPMYFSYAGGEYVNTFVPMSIPVREPLNEAREAVQEFVNHLFLLCGRRIEVYDQLLKWLAYNVQFPGRKIRWSPLIKGAQGDGKSIIGDVLRAALGARNVNNTAISTLTNSGGFTDWATGYAVNIIEEIHLVGKERHKLFNSMKQFIGDTVININAKGRASTGSLINVTNHIATTNFNDALPVDDQDRRWMIIFSPYDSISDACADKGYTVDQLIASFKMIGDAARMWPGQFRDWLCSVDVSDFNPDGRAPVTEEKGRMVATSEDGVDEIIRDLIDQGGQGIHVMCFSSGALQARAHIRAMAGTMELPKTAAWSHTLSRLGYEKLAKPIWWNNSTHRVWAKAKISKDIDAIRKILDGTLT